MFGYVRPVRDELKCKDFDLYRATYCGLCRAMRKRCGLFAPMVLNFDFVFLALLLAGPEGQRLTRCHRCHIPPFHRKCMCELSEGVELAADESVILAYWQIQDRIHDEAGIKKIPAYFARFFLRRGYRRAAAARPEFNLQVAAQLQKLHNLEKSACSSLDRPADTFALLLCAAAPETSNPAQSRPMSDLLYHLGRWIYLIDARDDLETDVRNGSYNPIPLRFKDSNSDQQLEITLNHSVNRMRAACALLDLGHQEALVENVVNFGIPTVQRAVFGGYWNKLKKQRIWRNDR